MTRFSKEPRCRREDGVYFVLMTIGIIGILAVAGLALDGAKIYTDSVNFKKAADAAVVAGLGYMIRNPNDLSATALVSAVKDMTKEVALGNLKSSGYEVGTFNQPEFSITVNLEPNAARTLSVTIEKDMGLFILGTLPMENFRSVKVTRHSDGRLAPANVALLLDVSGSMNCPAVVLPNLIVPAGAPDPNECPCLKETDPNKKCQFAGSKLAVLITAVNGFLDKFSDGYDHISIVPFNTGAAVLPGRSMSDSFTKADWKNSVNAFYDATAGSSATGNTNHSDALITAYLDAANAAHAGRIQGEIAYVFFSDGAPTAARLLLRYPDPNKMLISSNQNPLLVPPVDPSDPNSGKLYDYQSFRVAWLWVDATQTPPVAETNYGPSALIDSAIPLFGHAKGYPPNWTPEEQGTPAAHGNPAGVPTCTAQYAHDPAPQPSPAPADRRWEAHTGCLAHQPSFSFHLPSDTVSKGGNVPMNSERWTEQYYNATIAMADYLRNPTTHPEVPGGRVYAIGLGTAPSADRNIPLNIPGTSTAILSTDPYQNAMRDFTRHDYFLARMALDPYAAEAVTAADLTNTYQYVFFYNGANSTADFHATPPYIDRFRDNTATPAVKDAVISPLPDFSSAGFTTGLASWETFFPVCFQNTGMCNPQNRYRYGEYLPTNDPGQLRDLFDRIGRKILLRLIEPTAAAATP